MLILCLSVCVFVSEIISRSLIGRNLATLPGIVLLDYEVIEVDELDEGNISATAENKTNYGRLS